MTDLEKRKRIMQRSIKLGHCICNPKEPCPCDLFKDKNVCLCAGERLEDTGERIELTKYSRKCRLRNPKSTRMTSRSSWPD